MARTVFWSWQSDRDGRVTRHLIRDALVKALDRIAASTELEERLEIDQDTKGKAGLADIVGSILEKIDQADVFVADITPIAVSDGGKQVANPNALIELGYAKKSLNPVRCVTIWNTAFTDPKPEDLPFDLRGRRAPITYSLPEGASKAELATAREHITAELVTWISGCLGEIPPPTPRALPWLPADEGNPAVWFEPRTPFPANLYRGGGSSIVVSGDIKFFARMLPATFDPAAIDSGAHPPLLGVSGGWSMADVALGTLAFPSPGSISMSPIEISGATLWVRDTGEVWAIESGLVSDWEGRKCFNIDWAVASWSEFLDRAPRHSLGHGGTGPFHLQLGVRGLTGLSVPVQSFRSDQMSALSDGLVREFVLETASKVEWQAQLRDLWVSMNRCFSLPAPDDAEFADMIRRHG